MPPAGWGVLGTPPASELRAGAPPADIGAFGQFGTGVQPGQIAGSAPTVGVGFGALGDLPGYSGQEAVNGEMSSDPGLCTRIADTIRVVASHAPA